MAEYKYVDWPGLQYYHSKITTLIDSKADDSEIVDLADKIKNNTDAISALQDASGQINVIEKIKINGAELTININDKSVDIPFATNDNPGVVRSSTDENKISIDTDGTMEVNSLNINKLVQTRDDTLILNGGSYLD